MRGVEQADWILNPGPGSKDMARRLANTPAGYVLDTILAPLAATAIAMEVATGAHVHGPAEVVTRAAGIISGLGMQAVVDSTMDLLRKRVPKPEVIVMAGWSRGAVTCLEISNALKEDKGLAGVPLHLFLFDPVPGGNKTGNGLGYKLNRWNWADYATTVPDNVKTCAVILMGDDDRANFEPLVTPFYEKSKKSGAKPTKFFVYPLPGEHRSAVEETDGFAPSKVIGAHLCHSFLIEHGVDLKDPLLLKTPVLLCDQYAALKLLASRAGGSEGHREKFVKNSCRESAYFVNWHNKKEFAKAFPRTARSLASGVRDSSIDSEKTLMSKYAPKVHSLLYGSQPRSDASAKTLQSLAARVAAHQHMIRRAGRLF